MLKIHFAPIQGYTDFVYRRIHHAMCGGIESYYTPFMRLEKGDSFRNKELRDALPENNEGLPVIAQIIASSRDEFCRLADKLQEMGHTRIDFNMGCSFPMQTHIGRGCSLLQDEVRTEEVFSEMRSRKEVQFSVKMRLGMERSDEALRMLPLFNEAPLTHITLHPRTAIQQFKGEPDREAFTSFYEGCRLPLLYNGDVTTAEQIEALEIAYPKLNGVMIGRGLLANPLLAREYASRSATDLAVRRLTVRNMHDSLFEWATSTLQGDNQILGRMRAFWEYQTDEAILPHKAYKRIMKCGNVKNYTIEIQNNLHA